MTIKLTLVDGVIIESEKALTVADVAAGISKKLAKNAIAARVSDKLVDTSHLIDKDASVHILTVKDDDAVEVIRHSCAHLLAQAVKILFPSAQVTIGPVIKDGFYYDFAFERAFTQEDLVLIEEKMHELVKQDLQVRRFLLSRQEALEIFATLGEKYKQEIIQDLPVDEDLSFYQQGDFVDLCRGPHVPSTAHIKAFKLTKVAGAYWRGNSDNVMLQRIYGTAWPDKQSLQQYLHNIEEAKKRDHRKIGSKLDLFHIQDIAPGMVFWHPKGWTLYQVIVKYIRKLLITEGYAEVSTPQLLDRQLWEKSGHWQQFRENMYSLEREERHYALKPMNCPCHIQLYNNGGKSYRDLPLRYAEFGSCHRAEPSGTLHGLMRVRNFVQDDGHIFCAEAEIEAEVLAFIKLVLKVYKDFGFDSVKICISTRPKVRVGSDEVWDKSELSLRNAVEKAGLDYSLAPGEGAFYGPKIEFTLQDCLGRYWQCGTIQVDFSMPERLGASFVNQLGEKQTPVMLHRAILGSIERFIGILLENSAGHLATWLAPVQVVILSLNDKCKEYAQAQANYLRNLEFRVVCDLRNESIGFKIREHTMQKIPFLLVAGEREVAEGTVAVRTQQGKDLGSKPISEFVAIMTASINNFGGE